MSLYDDIETLKKAGCSDEEIVDELEENNKYSDLSHDTISTVVRVVGKDIEK
jgi:hypothetical protein